MKAREKGKAC